MPKLESWSIVIQEGMNPYKAPELHGMCLHGVVKGHSRIKDGKTIRTSKIISAIGKIIKTYSGSVYELGQPSQKYLDWLKENNIPFDIENPFPTLCTKEQS